MQHFPRRLSPFDRGATSQASVAVQEPLTARGSSYPRLRGGHRSSIPAQESRRSTFRRRRTRRFTDPNSEKIVFRRPRPAAGKKIIPLNGRADG
jgi:hypothetical protein